MSGLLQLPAAGGVTEPLLRTGKGAVTCGGAKGTRTPNPLLAKQVRYQLRHGPRRMNPRRKYDQDRLTLSVASAQSSCSRWLARAFRRARTAAAAASATMTIFFIGWSFRVATADSTNRRTAARQREQGGPKRT